MTVTAPGAIHPRVASPGSEGPGDAIVVTDVRKRFGPGPPALDGCSLHVRRGEFISLLGPSGCGKTTLLRIIGGFEQQDSGSVEILGELADGQPPNRRKVNTVFQSYALFPHKSVAENIAFPLAIRGVPKRERAERVREMLDLVHLPGVEERSATKLSGGQAQRVALARALVSRPQVLLLDEPLAALDLKLRKAMQLELRRIQEQLETTFVYVTHDQEEALTMSDRIVLMNRGKIVQGGTPEDVYDRPANVFVSDFVGEVNLVEATVVSFDGDAATLRSAAGPLRVEGVTAPVEGAAVLAIRPERISLHPAGAVDAPATNALEGRIERLVFLGNLVRSLVSVAGGQVLTVQLRREEAGALHEGDRVAACFEAGAATLLPADAADRG